MTNEMAFQCMHGHARTCGTLHCVLSEHICYQLVHLCAHLQAPAASSSGAAAEAAAEGEEQAAEATRRPVTYGPHHVPLPRQDFTAFIHAVAKADLTAKGMTRRQKRQRREHLRNYAWNRIFADPMRGEEARVCRHLIAAHRETSRMLHVPPTRAGT